MTRITRREGLLAGLFGSGYIGLRALATGLPAWYLLNPSRATAQDLQCAITARANLQYLIVSTSSNGDPLHPRVVVAGLGDSGWSGAVLTRTHGTDPGRATGGEARTRPAR